MIIIINIYSSVDSVKMYLVPRIKVKRAKKRTQEKKKIETTSIKRTDVLLTSHYRKKKELNEIDEPHVENKCATKNVNKIRAICSFFSIRWTTAAAVAAVEMRFNQFTLLEHGQECNSYKCNVKCLKNFDETIEILLMNIIFLSSFIILRSSIYFYSLLLLISF